MLYVIERFCHLYIQMLVVQQLVVGTSFYGTADEYRSRIILRGYDNEAELGAGKKHKYIKKSDSNV